MSLAALPVDRKLMPQRREFLSGIRLMIEVLMKRRVLVLMLILPTVVVTGFVSDTSARESEETTPHARWESAIRRFEEADHSSPRPRDGVLFVGSSSVRSWNLRPEFLTGPISHSANWSHHEIAARICWKAKHTIRECKSAICDCSVGIFGALMTTFNNVIPVNPLQ